MLGGFGDVEGALYDLLGHEVLVERLPLAPEDQQPTLRLEMSGRGREGGEVGGDGGVSWLLKDRHYGGGDGDVPYLGEEEHHVSDCPHDPLGTRNKTVKLKLIN